MANRFKVRGRKLATVGVALMLAFSTASLSTVVSYADEVGSWHPDFNTIEDEQEYARELATEIMSEGIVLMKNKDNTLPLKNAKNITLFGARSYDIITGGTGSGSGSSTGYISLTDALEMAGYNLNSKVKNIYETKVHKAVVAAGGVGSSGAAIHVESPISDLAPASGSYAYYHDAAIMTISRTGGEGSDLLTHNIPTHTDKTDHVLSLDDNEKALIDHMKDMKHAYGMPIIILVNSANVFELGELQNDPDIDAILWIGQPGGTGLKAVGQVLNGTVNPSGRTVDIYPADLKKDPTWYNAHTYEQYENRDAETGEVIGEEQYANNSIYGADGKEALSGNIVEYEEDIYLGYKYYETRAKNYKKAITAIGEKEYEGENKGEQWYQDTVVYPFGYGLSYTTFEQSIVTSAGDIQAAINSKSGLDDKIQITVKVTNKGTVAGKEVVQLYMTAPYTAGQIAKSEVVLVSYAKTDLLQPNESQNVVLDVRICDLASFDYNDANNNNYKGWELEAGDYEFTIRQNSHEVVEKTADNVVSASVNLDAKKLDNDGDSTNNTPLSNGDVYDSLLNIEYGSTMKKMTRDNMEDTFPTPLTIEERTYTDAKAKNGKKAADFITLLGMEGDAVNTKAGQNTDYTRYNSYYNSDDDKTTDPWYVESVPESWTQGAGYDERVDGKAKIQLYQMAGLDYWDESKTLTASDTSVEEFIGKTPKEAWDIFVNQATWEEMVTLISGGGWQCRALDALGKDFAYDENGPAQLVDGNRKGDRTTYWPCAVVVASTWNVDLAYEQGAMIGNESLFIDVPGWYGNAMNIHRSPFSGRNFEYYSQDALQGGFIAAAVVAGAQSKGVYAYIKHFGLNDQETDRHGIGTFASEQTIRENYFKTFEYSVKDGGAKACMTAFNRVGAINEFANYMTLTEIMRNEWGFKGQVVTDAYRNTLGKANYLQRGGCDIPLGNFSGDNSISGTWDATLRGGKGGVRDGAESVESATQYSAVRMSATRVLWVASNTSVNENGLQKSLFKDGTLSMTVGVASDATVAVDTAKYGTTNVRYQVESGTLPEGVELDANTGALSGTPAKEGSYEVKLNLIGDGWSKATATFTINVAPLHTVSSPLTATVGTQFSTKFTTDKFTVGGMYNGYEISKVAYSLRTDVEGLEMAADGTLSGTPTTAGVYDITVRTSVTYPGGRNGANTTANIDATYVLTVSESGETTVDQNEVQFRVENGVLEYKVGDGEWKAVDTVSKVDPETSAPAKDSSGLATAALVIAILGTVIAIGGVVKILLTKKKD